MRTGRIESFRDRYGSWVVVAGGSDGIGAEFARQLAKRGLNLLLVGRRTVPLEALAAELAGRFAVETRTSSRDLTRPAEVEALIEETSGLDVGLMVCNAARSVIAPFLGQPMEGHDRMLDLNCRTPLRLAHAFGRRMVARGRGGIVLLSSMASFGGTLLSAHYAATKAYLRVLAEGLWAELRPFGVDLVASCPGTVRTPTFLKDNPVERRLGTLPVIECEPAVRDTLRALGRRPVVVPGRVDRLVAALMQRLLPRRALIALTARATRLMYPTASDELDRARDEARRSYRS